MLQKLSLIVLFMSFSVVFSQKISGNELLQKAIDYHDPNHNWEHFNENFLVTMTMPNKPKRISNIKIDLRNDYFSVKATKEKETTEYILDKNVCTISFNGEKNTSEEIKKEHNLSCDRASLYKNYYTYLYGLPMKLKDKGTIIDEKVETKEFKGKEYLVLKATYEASVGKDTWYFYFNPKTYAMEVYQFFKDTKNSGEYILLSGEEVFNGIKIPKTRAWYYNKDDIYLGTDTLTKQ